MMDDGSEDSQLNHRLDRKQCGVSNSRPFLERLVSQEECADVLE